MAGLGARLGACLSAVLVVAVAATLPSGPASASGADTSPPVVDSVTGPVAVQVGPAADEAPVTYTWSAHDPEGSDPVTYDLRYAFPDTTGDLVWQSALDHAWDTTWTTTVRFYEGRVCVEVRAHDGAGNTSAWSALQCTAVDNGPPWVHVVVDPAHSYGLANVLQDALAGTPVAYTYAGSDDDQIASYDVDVRVAQPGSAPGPWTSPPAWQGTTATSVTMTGAPGADLCFRVRARDRAGYVSGYDNAWCKAIPYDDRDLQVRGVGHRRFRANALGGTVTKLWGRRGWGTLVRRGITAQQVWVRFAGPRDAQACAWVSLAGRRGRAGCFLERVPGGVWQDFRFRPGTYGTLKIRSAYSVDAVAIVP